MTKKLKVNEIFYSLQGETNTIGFPTVFIRLTGCPLRCKYCDTKYAYTEGKFLEINEIMQIVKQYKAKYVTLTGGEPLAQRDSISLLNSLIEQEYIVSLETSGALDISSINPKVIKILDIKTPDSGESKKNLFKNIQYLNLKDQIKFVICSRKDYLWAKDITQKYNLNEKQEIIFSPNISQLAPQKLAKWILKDNLHVRFQLQLHKILWKDKRGC